MHRAEPLLPEPRPFEVEISIEKLKRYKSPGIYQIPAEFIHAEGETCSDCETHKIPQQWNESISVPLYKKGNNADCCNYRDVSML
jgi:hypothetical protein